MGNGQPVISDAERERFDALLEGVLAELPSWVGELLERIPLVVEDYPSRRVLDQLGVDEPWQLCGLHTGVPLTDRSPWLSGVEEDVIHIYREGILEAAADRRGHVRPAELRKQIRTTVLHEIGHHFGMDEDELARLGYG